MAEATALEPLTMTPDEVMSVLPELAKARIPTLIVGPPGIGKTDLVYQTGNLIDAGVEVFFPATDDPTDYKGLGMASPGDPIAKFLPYEQLYRLHTASRLTIAFLDDLGQAIQGVQAPIMQMIHARRACGLKISDHVVFFAASNDRKHKAGVMGMIEPLKSRFGVIIHMVGDTKAWLRWARANGVSLEMCTFIEYRPDLLNKFEATAEFRNTPSPRTVVAADKNWKLDLPLLAKHKLIAGAAGTGFSDEFVGFVRRINDWPNFDGIMANPEGWTVPTDPALLFALTALFAKNATMANLANIMKAMSRMPPEFQSLVMRNLKTRSANFLKHPATVTWQVANQDVVL